MNRFWSKRNSITPEFLAEQEHVCKAIIDGLAKAIKELQLMFAEENGEEIQDCRATQRLCSWFEHVLRHGLKTRLFSQTASFWPLAVKISRKQAIDQLKSLQYAHTEMGRSRAWIRLAVNELSLESYINVIVSDKQLLSQYYEEYSFMRNEELTGAMSRLLIGLSQLDIHLQVDTMNLEFDTPLEAMHAPVKKLSVPSSGIKVPRRKEDKQKEVPDEPLSQAELEELLKEAETFTVSSVRKSPVKQEHKPAEESIAFEKPVCDFVTQPSQVEAVETEQVEEKKLDENTEVDTLQDVMDEPIDVPEDPVPVVTREDSPTEVEDDVLLDCSVEVDPTTLEEGGGEVEDDHTEEKEDTGTPENDSNTYEEDGTVCAIQQEDEHTVAIDNSVELLVSGDPFSGTDPSQDSAELKEEDEVVVGNNPFGEVDSEGESERNSTSPKVHPVDIPSLLSGGDTADSRDEVEQDQGEQRSVVVTRQYSQVLEDLTVMFEKNEESALEACLYEYDIVELTQALQEDHFSKDPTTDELQEMIASIKRELRSLPGTTSHETRLALQDKLVKYQVAVHWMKEIHSSGILPIMDHQFVRQKKGLVRGISCDICGMGILGIIRSWYRCQDCQITCHKSCLVHITRKCVYEKARNAKLILEICPRQGLTAQHFRCNQCNKAIGIARSKIPTAKLCDYTGNYFCRDCYHKEMTIIPARVVHNWDFAPRGVSCEAYELLQILYTRPLIHVSSCNPKLYTYVQDLKDIEELRRDILLMIVYLLSCADALRKRLLLKLDRYPHFKESADMFSLQDLVQVLKGKVLTDVQDIHRVFSHHIKEDCQICFRKGTECLICGSNEVIFPFDKHVLSCCTCLSLFHKTCIGDSLCTYCTRRQTHSGTSSPFRDDRSTKQMSPSPT